MAIKISNQQPIPASIVSVEDISYSSPLLNYIEIDNIGGVNKTKFFTNVMTNVKVGDWVYIVNGYYDNSKIGKVKSTRKGANGWKVLKVNNCEITLDIDWSGVLPYKEDLWDNFIKFYHASTQLELDTFCQQFTYENTQIISGNEYATNKFSTNKNSIIYISNPLKFDSVFNNPYYSPPGIYKHSQTLGWQYIVTQFDLGNILGLSSSNNSRLLIPDSFSYSTFVVNLSLISSDSFNFGGPDWTTVTGSNSGNSAIFSVGLSNELVYSGTTNSLGLTINSSLISLIPGHYYSIEIQIMTNSSTTLGVKVNVGTNASNLLITPGTYYLTLLCTGNSTFGFQTLDTTANFGTIVIDNLSIYDNTYTPTFVKSFDKNSIYNHDSITSTWEFDPEYKSSYIGKSNFRDGLFSGIWNDGIYGSYDKKINWNNGYWNNGVMMNSVFNGQMDSKTDYNRGLKIYYTTLKDNLPKTNLDTNNYFGDGLNYIIDSDVNTGWVRNGNFKYCNIYNTSSVSVMYNEIMGISASINSLTMSYGSIYKSEVKSINLYNTKLYNSYIDNTKLIGSKLYNSHVKKSVGDSIEVNTDGYKILKYKEDSSIIYSPLGSPVVTIIHKFYISKEDWLKLESKSIISIKDLLFNEFYPQTILEDTFYLNWKSLMSRVSGASDGFILRSAEQNTYTTEVLFESGQWVNKFKLNIDKGYSIDFTGIYNINLSNPNDGWRSSIKITKSNDNNKPVGNITSINNAYLYSSSFESGIIKNSNWISGNNTEYEYISRTLSFTNSGTYAFNLTSHINGIPGSYSLVLTTNQESTFFYKKDLDIDNNLFYIHNLNAYHTLSATTSVALDGWYQVITQTYSTPNETLLTELIPLTGDLLTNTLPITYYIDVLPNITFFSSELVNPSSFLQPNINRLRIDNSNIYSGLFRGIDIFNSNLISVVKKDNNINQVLFNNLKLSNINFDKTNLINKGASIYNSQVLDITWDNGLLYRSIYSNNKPFNDGLAKEVYWYDSVFNNGKFIDSNNSIGLYKISSSFNLDISSPLEWISGTFNNGEMYKSKFSSGTINNGLIWYSTITSQYGNTIINGGIFGDKSIDKSLTYIDGNLSNIYNIVVNYATSNNATFKGKIIWNDGIFNDGVMWGIESTGPNPILGYIEYAPKWYNGIFNNGSFAGNSKWYNGEFKGGRFTAVYVDTSIATLPDYYKKSGILNSTHDNYSWVGGVFSGGIFGEEDPYLKIFNPIGKSYRSSWYNGLFLGGKFVGRVWNDGVFVNGEFEGMLSTLRNNKISTISSLYNSELDSDLGGWTSIIEDALDRSFVLDKSKDTYFSTTPPKTNTIWFRISPTSAPDFADPAISIKNINTILTPGKKYRVSLSVIYVNNPTSTPDQAFFVSLGGNYSIGFYGVGIFEDFVVCGSGGLIELFGYAGAQMESEIDYINIYEVFDDESITVNEGIELFTPQYDNNWYGVFRTGSVVDTLKKTTGEYASLNLPAGSPLLKENYKTNNPTKFNNVLFINGVFDDTTSVMNNSIWLNGNFNNGLFDHSYFNPYVKRWDYVSWIGGLTISSAILPAYNGTFNFGGGGWPTSVSYDPGQNAYASASIIPSNRLYYTCEFDGPGCFVTSSNIIINPYTQYDISFDIFTASGYQPEVKFSVGNSLSSPYNAYDIGTHTFSIISGSGDKFVIQMYQDDGGGGDIEIDNLIINQATAPSYEIPYSYELNTQSCVWNNGILDGESEFSISDWNNGLFKMGSMYGSQFNKGTVYYMSAYNIVWNDGRWRNGNWYGSNMKLSNYNLDAPYPQNKYIIFKNKTFTSIDQKWDLEAGAYNDQIVMSSLRNNSHTLHNWNLFNDQPNNKKKNETSNFSVFNNNDIIFTTPSYIIQTSTISTIDGPKLHYGFKSDINIDFDYNQYQNLSYTSPPLGLTVSGLSLGNISFQENVQIILPPVNGYPNQNVSTSSVLVDTKFGNGTFKKGTWENGVWNNGNRLETAHNNKDKFVRFLDVVTSYEITPTLWRVTLKPIKDEYDKFTSNIPYKYDNLSIGDDIIIGNLVLIDINNIRKVNKSKTKINNIDPITGYISFDIIVQFPIRNIERDSKYHLMYVTKNIWLGGKFLHGAFSGVFTDGNIYGYPAVTNFRETQLIDGIMEGMWFKSETFTYSNADTVTISNYNTSLIQKGYILNRYKGFSYLNCLDFIYSSQSTTNNSIINNRKTTEDVLECSMLDEFTSTRASWYRPIKYEYGTKYKVYNDLLSVSISNILVSSSQSNLSNELGWYTKDITNVTYSNYISTKIGDGSDFGVFTSFIPNIIDNYTIGYTHSYFTQSNPLRTQGLYNINNSIDNYRYSRVKYDLINIGTFSITGSLTSFPHVSGWNSNYNPPDSEVNDILGLTGTYQHYYYGQTKTNPILMTRDFNGRLDNILYEELDRIPLPNLYKDGFFGKSQFIINEPHISTASVIIYKNE